MRILAVLMILAGMSCSWATAPVLSELQRELGPGFRVLVHEKIFYVASDAPEARIQVCLDTITRIRETLVKNYVKKSPVEPLRVYLFKDDVSYGSYCRTRLGESPSTPFGFYLDSDRKLVMNIATGTGTLAHELVHPYIESDFPGAPAWFNEGFASLFEQSRWNGAGELLGEVNWRLPGLQTSIRSGKCPPLSRLMTSTVSEFYNDNSGVHYALARYLCLYLQQKSKLKAYYHAYRDEYSKDVTGRKPLERVLGKPLAEIDSELRLWIQSLTR